MQSASVNELDQNFNVLIPQGNVQTGSKHSHHNVCYTEYMCSKLEPRVMGNLEVYLNLDIFRRDNHAARVKELFEETVPGYPHAPAPRPMKAHTFDFNCTYHGARILDGECKASTTKVERLHGIACNRTVGDSRSGNVYANNIALDGILQDGEDERFRMFEDNDV